MPAYRDMLETLGLERVVIVQPSVYGTDNRCTRDAIAAFGDAARGVAVIDADTRDDEIAALVAAGFRGTRFNLVSAGGVAARQIEQVAARIADHGWHLQIYATRQALSEMRGVLTSLPVEIVIDHFGRADIAAGPEAPEFHALIDLLAGGRAWLKISGAYRIDDGPAPWPQVDPLARALLTRVPDRLVWGSDWPHPTVTGPMPDDGDLFDALVRWTDGDDALLQAVLVDNPARLYGF